jgi:hypothetical protein
MTPAARRTARAVRETPWIAANHAKARAYEEAQRALHANAEAGPAGAMTDAERASLDARLVAEKALLNALTPKGARVPGHVPADAVLDQVRFMGEAIDKLEEALDDAGQVLTEEPWVEVVAELRAIRTSLRAWIAPMSAPDDLNERETLDELPHDTDGPPTMIIPAGGADLAVGQALHRALVAHQELEAVAMAVARQLDASAEEAR